MVGKNPPSLFCRPISQSENIVLFFLLHFSHLEERTPWRNIKEMRNASSTQEIDLIILGTMHTVCSKIYWWQFYIVRIFVRRLVFHQWTIRMTATVVLRTTCGRIDVRLSVVLRRRYATINADRDLTLYAYHTMSSLSFKNKFGS